MAKFQNQEQFLQDWDRYRQGAKYLLLIDDPDQGCVHREYHYTKDSLQYSKQRAIAIQCYIGEVDLSAKFRTLRQEIGA